MENAPSPDTVAVEQDRAPANLAGMDGALGNKVDPAAPKAVADELVTVSDLANALGITPRTLRFYEDKGLIAPRRIGANRVYSHRDRARMIIVLRGKRLGFSIREIRTFLDLYDADPRQVTQMRALLEKIAERRRDLEEKRDAIVEALRGLDDLQTVAAGILAEAGVEPETS